jgi:predicted dehydrogenase
LRETSQNVDGTGIKTLGVAAIGYAFMGKAHSNAWRNVASFFDVPAFQQKVLVGRNPEQVAEAAARYGWSESATDWRSVLERDDIHVVDICAPGWMHAEIAIAALEAGKHVLVEKPLANALALARELIAEGKLGPVRHVRASYMQDWLSDPESPMTWRLNKETAGRSRTASQAIRFPTAPDVRRSSPKGRCP